MNTVRSYFLFCGIAAMVLYAPIAHWFVIPAFLLALFGFIKNKCKIEGLEKGSQKFVFIAVGIYWGIYLVDAIINWNSSDTWFSVQVKSTLLYFPLAFLLQPFPKLFRQRFLIVFLVAILLKIPIALTISYLNSEHMIFRDFTYVRLTYDGHPSYISFYYILGFILLFQEAVKKESIWNKYKFWGCVLVLFLFTVFVFLLSSKAGVISLAAVFGVFVLSAIFKPGNRIAIVKVITVVFSITTLLIYLNPELVSRFTGIQKVVTETDVVQKGNDSNASRINLWIAAKDLWQKAPIFGRGSENIDEQLFEQVEENGASLKRKFNVHNQFLHETIVHGLVGLTSLLLMLLTIFKRISKDRWVGLSVLAVIFIELAVECVLNRQAGVVIFGFLLGVSMIISKDEKKG